MRSSGVTLYLLLILVASSALQSHPWQFLSRLESLELEGQLLGLERDQAVMCQCTAEHREWRDPAHLIAWGLWGQAGRAELATLDMRRLRVPRAAFQSLGEDCWEMRARLFLGLHCEREKKAVGMERSRNGSIWMFGRPSRTVERGDIGWRICLWRISRIWLTKVLSNLVRIWCLTLLWAVPSSRAGSLVVLAQLLPHCCQLSTDRPREDQVSWRDAEITCFQVSWVQSGL